MLLDVARPPRPRCFDISGVDPRPWSTCAATHLIKITIEFAPSPKIVSTSSSIVPPRMVERNARPGSVISDSPVLPARFASIAGELLGART